MGWSIVWAVAAALAAATPSTPPAADSPRVFETVLPALAYSASCSSTVSLRNVAGRAVSLEIEAHRSDGALVAIDNDAGSDIQLAPGESGHFKLHIDNDAGDAWALIRERVPSAGLSPAVAVSGVTECLAGNELSRAAREVAYPRLNPKFSGQADALAGEVLLLVNASEEPASAWVCESSVGYYMLPPTPEGPARSRPICSTEFETQIAPFGTRRFPIGEGSAANFFLESRGDRIVLQMLKPLRSSVRLFSVDSSITFGDEVQPAPPANR